MFFPDDTEADVVDALNQRLDIWTTFFNVDSPYLKGMVSHIDPAESQLKKANTSDTEVLFLDLHLSVLDGFISSKIYDKRGDDLDFDIIDFPFLDGGDPRTSSYGVYISQLIRFARVSIAISLSSMLAIKV